MNIDEENVQVHDSTSLGWKVSTLVGVGQAFRSIVPPARLFAEHEMKIYVLVGRLGQYIHCGRLGFLTDCTPLLPRGLRRKKCLFNWPKFWPRDNLFIGL